MGTTILPFLYELCTNYVYHNKYSGDIAFMRTIVAYGIHSLFVFIRLATTITTTKCIIRGHVAVYIGYGIVLRVNTSGYQV